MPEASQDGSRTLLLVSVDAEAAAVIRQAVALVPGGAFQVEIVHRCADAVARLALVTGTPVAAVLLDLMLPDRGGVQAFEAVQEVALQLPILIRCRQRDEGLARQCLECGAQDYVLEESADAPTIAKALGSALLRAASLRARRLVAERSRITLDSIGDAVVSMDATGNVTYLNPVAEGMTGWSLQAATGQPASEVLRIVDADSRESAPHPLATAMARDRPVGLRPNSVLVRRDGQEVQIEDTAAPIHDRAGAVTGAVIVFHDVSAARVTSRRMSHLAHHDFLTGLPNRLLLNDRLAGSIALARRHRKALAVLFLDVDRFKFVNDTYGHTVGDALLRSIAQRLVGCVRGSDTVSRQGGDEFVILLAEVAHAEDAALCATKIHAAMRQPHRIDGHELHVTVSIGVGVYPEDGKDARTLLRNADLALIQARTLQRADRPALPTETTLRRFARSP